MPLCNQTWVEDVFLCVGLLNECTQVGETHYGDHLVFFIGIGIGADSWTYGKTHEICFMHWSEKSVILQLADVMGHVGVGGRREGLNTCMHSMWMSYKKIHIWDFNKIILSYEICE